ncbi:hypothetical protein CRYUN_Cryun07bG0185400 [Craigia yunnanensis]
MATSSVKQTLGNLNKESFVSFLIKIIGEFKFLQNNSPELIPEEDRVVKHVLDCLLPYSTTAGGGPLIVNHGTHFPGRGNLIVEYPGTEHGKILSFVGMHMDDFDPFSLSIDGDKLRGRGTTDCLGHVALVTELMRRLAETKPKLKSTVVAVFIANEEKSAITGVGVDALVKDGLLDKLKGGLLFWIDTADKQPCIGAGGMIPWKLYVTGKLFHSGLVHKAINALELGMEALKEIQLRFIKTFHPIQMSKSRWWNQSNSWRVYNIGRCQVYYIVRLFTEPVDIKCYLNKTPFLGCRLTPFYNLTLTFDEAMSGVACNLDSRGFHVLCKATAEAVGHVKSYSITGSCHSFGSCK